MVPPPRHAYPIKIYATELRSLGCLYVVYTRSASVALRTSLTPWPWSATPHQAGRSPLGASIVTHRSSRYPLALAVDRMLTLSLYSRAVPLLPDPDGVDWPRFPLGTPQRCLAVIGVGIFVPARYYVVVHFKHYTVVRYVSSPGILAGRYW